MSITVVIHQLQVRCRPVKVRRSKTDVLPLSYTANQSYGLLEKDLSSRIREDRLLQPQRCIAGNFYVIPSRIQLLLVVVCVFLRELHLRTDRSILD